MCLLVNQKMMYKNITTFLVFYTIAIIVILYIVLYFNYLLYNQYKNPIFIQIDVLILTY